MAREVFGGDPRCVFAAGLELASVVVRQREGEGLAEVIRIGEAKGFVAHGTEPNGATRTRQEQRYSDGDAPAACERRKTSRWRLRCRASPSSASV